MLDGCPQGEIIQCGGGDSTVCKGVGEHRSNTFTSTRSNACFLVGIIKILIHHLDSVNSIQHEKQTKHKYFYIFTPKQVKSVEITPN